MVGTVISSLRFVLGYYIVNYDERNWNKLSDIIMDLPPISRAQLISDSMDLARANLLSYDIPLKMIAKMAANDKNIMIIPTIIALNKLQFLRDILSNTPAFGHFEVSNIWVRNFLPKNTKCLFRLLKL